MFNPVSCDCQVHLIGVENLVHTLEEVEFHAQLILFCSGQVWDILVWVSLGQSQFNLGFTAPGVYHLLWSPDPDEGSPTGCLWWSPMGGEVTYMYHILRGRM